MSDFEIITDKNGVEYIAIRNNDYISYIIKDLESYDSFIKEYEMLENIFNKQKFYILELENKISDSDMFINSLKQTIKLQGNTIAKLNEQVVGIKDLRAIDKDEIETLKDKIKKRNKTLFFSICLNVLLTTILIL